MLCGPPQLLPAGAGQPHQQRRGRGRARRPRAVHQAEGRGREGAVCRIVRSESQYIYDIYMNIYNIISTISTISTWISTGETPRGAALHACAEPKIQPAEQIRGEPAAAPAQTRDAGEGRRRPGHPPPLPAQPLPNPTPGQSHVPGGLLAAGQPRHAVAAARAGGL